MNVTKTKLQDVYILEPEVLGDKRGWFMESWSDKTMRETGLCYKFVQDNHSFSATKGTLRGLHYQKGKAVQAKLVRCSRGAVLDIAVDMRIGSPTYKQWISVELTEENYRQLLIPRGFLHGFITQTNNVEFQYKADNFYDYSLDRSIIWNDPELNVDWGTDNPVVSEKDAKAPLLKHSDINFIYNKRNLELISI